MCENNKNSFLNAKILANHFRDLCENFSSPFNDGKMWTNVRKLESHKELFHTLTQIRRLINEEKVDGVIFKGELKKINKNIIHLEILWYLEVYEIMTLKEFIRYHEENGNEEIVKHVARQVYENVLAQNRNYSKLRKEMLKTLIKDLFECNNGEVDTGETYRTILDLIRVNLKEFYKSEEDFEDVNLDLAKLIDVFDESKLSIASIKLFLIQILKSLLQGHPQTVRGIFKKQEKLKNNVKDKKIIQFFNKISKYCEHGDLMAVLEGELLETKEIEWDNVFAFITFLGSAIKDGWGELRKLSNTILKISFENSDVKLLSVVFLIARQGCFEKSNPFFPSYIQWFSSTFSAESRRPINSKQRATFFFDFLTHLIPFDLSYYSKVHINRVPWVPMDCHSLLNEYVTIVKTHLCDLNVSVELGICENTTGKSAAVFDVENVVKHYERTNEILNSVFQASMFCKEYYEKKFLVELLSKFEGKKSARNKLITKLHSLGKIPNSMFKTYKSLEKKK